MQHKILRDESGMTMGLVVIMIVLIGVMGAGLLVFVQRDLATVVEVNRGQQAFETADAGVQAARRQLLSDARIESYDGNGTGESDWSFGDPSGAGRNLTLDGKTMNVRVRYLPAARAPANPNQDQAPELIPASAPASQMRPPSGCRFFKVTSDANMGTGGARRKIEAILCASQLNVPTAYYTPKTIEFDGNVNVSGVSFFARENIKGVTSGSVSIDRITEALYKDWDSTKFDPTSNHNTTARSVTAAGFGAEGRVCGNATCTTSVADGVNDFDSTTSTKFIRKSTPQGLQTSSEITYPFETDTSTLIRFLEDEARRQLNYYSAPQDIDSTTNGGKAKYPETSDERTVFFMDANGQTADIDYAVNNTPQAQGTIVVRNGNLKINNSSNGFKGVIIVTGNGSTTGKYQSSGNDTVEGFVIADGNMTIRGTVAPFVVTDDFTNRPGFYGVDIWSWRELYE